MVSVGLVRVEGSPEDHCERFLKCLIDRLYEGPPEHREPGEAQGPQVDVSDHNPQLPLNLHDLDRAKQLVSDEATRCNPNWQALFRFADA
jgi:hypothetical protein